MTYRVANVMILMLTIVVSPVFAFGEKPAESGVYPLSTTVDGKERAGAIYLPVDFNPKQKYPLIVFLHGSGERGSDGKHQTTVGLGKAIMDNPERFPCIVYMPQCPTDDDWSGKDVDGDGTNSHDHIQRGIKQIMKRYSIDKNRVSITGLSMGGRGTFAFGAKYAKQFSAFMPVCGQSSKRLASALSIRPIWIFHGDADTVVPPERSKILADGIRKEGGDVKYTLYPGVGHNSWDRAYGKAEGAVEWLLEQKR